MTATADLIVEISECLRAVARLTALAKEGDHDDLVTGLAPTIELLAETKIVLEDRMRKEREGNRWTRPPTPRGGHRAACPFGLALMMRQSGYGEACTCG
jgi:hypothetical protein